VYFSDKIRETGRDLRTIAGQTDFFTYKSLGEGFAEDFYDDGYDEIIRDNWKIVLDSYERAEKRLLTHIAEKSEDVKSLGDGGQF
jgi:hypothetical protein